MGRFKNIETQLRLKVFKTISVVYVVAPIFGEYSIYYGSGQISNSLYSSLALSFSSIVLYSWYHLTKKFKHALIISTFLQLGFYSIGLFLSGGIRAEHFFYMTFFPVANGFLLGKRAAFMTTGYTILYTCLLAILENQGTIPFTYHSLMTVLLQSTACLAFVGWIIIQYEKSREQTELGLEEALAQAKAQKVLLQKILATIPNMVFVKDYNHDLRFVIMNAEGEKILNASATDIVGKNDYDFFPKEQADFFTQKDREVFSSGKIIKIEAEPIETSQGTRILRTYKVPTYKDDGSPDLLIGISTDITEEIKTEIQYRSLIDSMHEGLIITDDQGKIIQCNPAALSFLDINADKIQDKFTSTLNMGQIKENGEVLPVEEYPSLLALRTKQNVIGKIVGIRNKNGELRWLQTNAHLIGTEQQQRVMVTFFDTTEIKRREAELKKQVEFSDAILRSAKFSIISCTTDGVIIAFNKEAERILEFSADEVVGKHTPALFHDPSEVTAVAALLSEQYNVAVPVGFETFVFKSNLGQYDERQWTYIAKNGKRVQVQLSITAIRDTSNKIYAYMGIARDLTEDLNTQHALELEKAKSLHNAKLASLGEMSAGIAHEINNPLAIASGNLELLEKYIHDPEKFGQKVNTILRSLGRIEKIVRSLSKFSRNTEAHNLKMVSISEIVNEALVLTGPKLKRYSVAFSVEIKKGLEIWCDGIEIEQVLVNLISNGVDAIKDQSERWLKIIAFREYNQIVVRVVDSGVGISLETEKKLFQPFFTTKAPGEGTGLGLSISKSILEQHCGGLALNRTFANTCFEIRLPLVSEKKRVA